jgi:hypothetical protein
LGQAVLTGSAAESGLEEGGRVGVGSDGPGEDDVSPAPCGCRSDRSRVWLQLYAYSDAGHVGPDDLAEFGTARVAADGQDGVSAVWSCQRAGPREVGSVKRVDMPREGARQAGRQVAGGDEVAKRRSESRPVERVVNGLAHPGVSG